MVITKDRVTLVGQKFDIKAKNGKYVTWEVFDEDLNPVLPSVYLMNTKAKQKGCIQLNPLKLLEATNKMDTVMPHIGD